MASKICEPYRDTLGKAFYVDKYVEKFTWKFILYTCNFVWSFGWKIHKPLATRTVNKLARIETIFPRKMFLIILLIKIEISLTEKVSCECTVQYVYVTLAGGKWQKYEGICTSKSGLVKEDNATKIWVRYAHSLILILFG